MIPTPRSDAAILRYTGGEPVTFPPGINCTVDYQFAQGLERELAIARDALEGAARRNQDLAYRVKALTDVGKQIYLAGKWSCDRMSPEEQAALWERFRDVHEISPGTATRLGVAA